MSESPKSGWRGTNRAGMGEVTGMGELNGLRATAIAEGDGERANLARGRAPVRIWLADRVRLLTESLAAYLEAEDDLEIIGTSMSLDEVALRRARPDVLVVSYSLLSEDESGVLHDLGPELPDMKIVVLIISRDDETLFTCVQAGAAGCVTQDRRPDDLAEAIRRTFAGEVLFAPDMLLRILRRYSGDELPKEEPDISMLTSRELQVLQAFAEGLTSQEVADRLIISAHTVRTHGKSALTKLGARTRAEAIAIASRHGLIGPAG